MQLDRTDYGILRCLQQDARISNKDLAERNGISPSTCLERVRRLRTQRVIRGFHAEIDHQVLGIGVEAMIAVRLNQHAQVSFDKLRDDLLKIPEVLTVYVLGGPDDFLVHAAVRDVSHLRELVCDTFTARPDVAHVETSLIFESARRTVLPNYGDPDAE